VASILLGQSIMCFLAFQRMRRWPMGLREELKVGLHRSLPLVGMALFILVTLGILPGSDLAAIAGIIFCLSG